jgi:hypothetical protein
VNLFEFPLLKSYTSQKFSIEFLTSEDSFLIVLPKSKIRINHHQPLICYEFVQGNFDSVVERSLNEVLLDLGIYTNIKISSITAIDLQEQFDINDIIEKA